MVPIAVSSLAPPSIVGQQKKSVYPIPYKGTRNSSGQTLRCDAAATDAVRAPAVKFQPVDDPVKRLALDVHRGSASFTRANELGNATVGAAQPPAKLAVDILHHHHVRMDVSLVTGVELLGRELVQHGRAFRDDGSRPVLHFDERHFAEKITGYETRHANGAPRISQPAHLQLAAVYDEHRAPRFTFRNHSGAGVEAALDQHG